MPLSCSGAVSSSSISSAMRTKLSLVSGSKYTTSSTRPMNSGRRNSAKALEARSREACASDLPKPMRLSRF